MQTVIDLNKKEGRPTKLIITDVEKAFDQAWRVGIFNNLLKRGIKGEILEFMWKINNNIYTRVRNDGEISKPFIAEESIRQGGGLSAILFGQHVASVIEDIEDEDMGKKVGNCKIPAVAWQDDVTLIPSVDEEDKMIKIFEKSTKKNKIKLAIEKKTKVLNIRGVEDKVTRIQGKIVEDVEEGRVLGYIFNKEGNADTHLEKKESDVIAMMANMCLTLSENNMERVYVQSLCVIYHKCFVKKMLYGLGGIPLTEDNYNTIESINRKVQRNFLNLPSSTPKVCLLNEFGMLPIKLCVWKKKLWWRISQPNANTIIKECRREQISSSLPWAKEITYIAGKLNVDLENVTQYNKSRWKKEINNKIRERTKEIIENGIDSLKEYNVNDSVKPGEQKRYMALPKRMAKIWFRMRGSLIDPAPRTPYSDNKWKCKFCNKKEQSTKHYIMDCKGIKNVFGDMPREDIFQTIQDLEGDDEHFKKVTQILIKVYNELIDDN